MCFTIFQFTPLREGLPFVLVPDASVTSFQFTPLREGLRWFFRFGRVFDYFNSRPCERGFLERQLRTGTQKYISIHAPARGASKSISKLCKQNIISIHAPARGASGTPIENDVITVFQFTPLREGLRLGSLMLVELQRISIHAPARGASRLRNGVCYVVNFNSRPCERGFENNQNG